jgi:cytochrome c peroxidase
MRRVLDLVGALAAIGLLSGCGGRPGPVPASRLAMPDFAPDEVEELRSLWLGSLPGLPDDPSNRVADDPAAAALGEAIFADTRFSANGEVSCSTCHQPELNFTDGLPRARGIAETRRKTMTVVGTAYSPWLFWNGRKDSQWAQALGPMEDAREHGGSRGMYAHLIDAHYRAEYEAIFGPLPDLDDRSRFPDQAGPVEDPIASANWESMTAADRDAVTEVYVNIGKSIAAYERGIMPGPTRFDTFVDALLADEPAGPGLLTADEIAGLRLFVGEAHCTNCHNGPLFTNNSFHNTGVPPVEGRDPDRGRSDGIGLVQADEFNCLSRWSDADPHDCTALRFLRDDADALVGAFKPPTLRNVSKVGPYMHAGQIATLADVLRHYREAPPAALGHSELQPLHLTDAQLAQLEAFLRTLDEVPAQ